MKKAFKIIIPLIMVFAIIGSICWYLLVYDRDFTRDVLLSQARYHSDNGNAELGSWFYGLAYEHTNQDDNIVIELANQYKADGNYTKAEYTLTNAIKESPTVELYVALCNTFVEQDKLLDAVNMLDNIADTQLRAELDALRPSAPTADPEPGFYSEYLNVSLRHEGGTLYVSTSGEYPSTDEEPYSQPIALPVGESEILCVVVGENGLVSPLTRLNYTIGGIVEPVSFIDPAIEAAVRAQLQVDDSHILYSNELWEITAFVVPEEATVFEDLILMPHLQSLTLQNQRLESLTFLDSLTELQTVNLSGCRFPADQLSVLTNLPQLRTLNLSNCGLSTIAGLSGANLTSLDLSGNTLRNLEPLANMHSLMDLNLNHNAVTELTALGGLTGLDKLDLSFNSVSDLEPLAGCIRLTWLDLSNNSITVLTALDKIPGLTHLSLDYNKLTDVAMLERCTKLKELSFSNNEVTDITMLASLTALDTFNFSYNQVTALPAWPQGTTLRIINGSHNKLKSLDQLKGMEYLSYVYMDYNSLTNIDAIANCYRLVMVNVYGNEIKDVSALTEHNIIVNYDPT